MVDNMYVLFLIEIKRQFYLRNQPLRRTERDFKLPPSAAKKDDCKTQ